MFKRNFNVVLLGDYAVGKTCLLHTYLRGFFQPEYVPSVRTSVFEKEYSFTNYKIKLFFWDVCGERVLDDSRKACYANAQAFIIVYDVCRPPSLKAVEEWCGMVRSTVSNPIIWLVGNKIDLKDSRLVSREEAEGKARSLGVSYIEVSAKTGENVEALFRYVLRDLVKARLEYVRKLLG
jgi:small GTP-binding protein